MSSLDELKIIKDLDDSDKEKIRYLLKLIMKEKKYKKLRMEIQERRQEIAKGMTTTHDELWQQLDV